MDYSLNIDFSQYDIGKTYYRKQKNTKDFITNLIKYAIMRDEFRRIKS